jgi:hypothetical protein
MEDSKHHFCDFKCAILFCAPLPSDPELAQRGIISDISAEGNMVNIPTAHIWSKAGEFHPGMGESLMRRCDPSMREEFIHNLGHEVPGSLSVEGLSGTLRAIERTIEKARDVD